MDERPFPYRRFDLLYSAVCAVFMIGLIWDFRIHAAGISFEEEGFLTLPHITIYGTAMIAGLFIIAAAQHVAGSDGILRAIPTGYRYSLLGAGLFVIGGPVDFFWHWAFGAESGLEALTSPAHLLLAVAGALLVTGPLRSAWFRGVERSFRAQFPLACSAAFIGTLIGAFGMYGNPLIGPIATGGSEDHAVLSVVAFTVLAVGLVLVLARRFALAPGVMTVTFVLLGLPFTLGVENALLVPMVVAGLTADVILVLGRAGQRPVLLCRLLGSIIPIALFGTYFLVHELIWGIAWTIHIWSGTLLIAVIVGVLVSYFVAPSERVSDPVGPTAPRRR